MMAMVRGNGQGQGNGHGQGECAQLRCMGLGCTREEGVLFTSVSESLILPLPCISSHHLEDR